MLHGTTVVVVRDNLCWEPTVAHATRVASAELKSASASRDASTTLLRYSDDFLSCIIMQCQKRTRNITTKAAALRTRSGFPASRRSDFQAYPAFTMLD